MALHGWLELSSKDNGGSGCHWISTLGSKYRTPLAARVRRWGLPPAVQIKEDINIRVKLKKSCNSALKYVDLGLGSDSRRPLMFKPPPRALFMLLQKCTGLKACSYLVHFHCESQRAEPKPEIRVQAPVWKRPQDNFESRNFIFFYCLSLPYRYFYLFILIYFVFLLFIICYWLYIYLFFNALCTTCILR